MDTKLTVALVEFLNAYPLYFALKRGIIKNEFDFISEPPSVCAALLRQKKAHVGNVPIVEYTYNQDYRLVRGCCIASNREVKSVVIFLNKPIEKVRTVKLDRNSNTSVVLTRVLFAFKYNLTVDYTYSDGADCELVIGDRALTRLNRDRREKIDLAVEWYEMTSLPFVFAAWISRGELPESVTELFVQSRDWGKANLRTICSDFGNRRIISEKGCMEYLSRNIDYDLDDEKIASIELFFDYAKRLGAVGENIRLRFT